MKMNGCTVAGIDGGSIAGDGNVIRDARNTRIIGNRNTLIGCFNCKVVGSGNTLRQARKCKVRGNDNHIWGEDNDVKGNGNGCHGTRNAMRGRDPTNVESRDFSGLREPEPTARPQDPPVSSSATRSRPGPSSAGDPDRTSSSTSSTGKRRRSPSATSTADSVRQINRNLPGGTGSRQVWQTNRGLSGADVRDVELAVSGWLGLSLFPNTHTGTPASSPFGIAASNVRGSTVSAVVLGDPGTADRDPGAGDHKSSGPGRQRRRLAGQWAGKSLLGLEGVGQDAVEGEPACLVCLTAKRDVLFHPCRHVQCCVECARNLGIQSRGPTLCPTCRVEVLGAEKIFL
jgi:hypothetical protein